ncbi:putative disease resistance protein At3g14460 [Prosopis cineraria]|uniref:putative disease resistance protein At3g14460 n=1 Tax=Prosopis cineraria TaxID=364024 RepID=UPI00240F8AA9|nr:putative disease resistance protein At3g14460 [Prosopis cineraria]
MALEAVGGAVISSFLQVAFERLASREVLDFFRGRKLDETLLDKLNICMLSLNAAIDDAEQKEITNPHVKAWLDMVKHAVYDAEDVLDEIDYEETKRVVEAKSQSGSVIRKVRNLLTGSASSFDKEIQSRIKQVLHTLEYLENRKDKLGLKEGQGASVGSVSKVPTTSLVDEPIIYGRDEDKEAIIQELLLPENDNSSQLSILSIVGMGGLGKTTLAKYVYNDARAQDGFELKAWVCISDDFDITRVTRAIIEAITFSSDDSKDLNVLQNKLKGMLTGKKFFLVLDDLWNENSVQLEALKTPFKSTAPGSKILVTTRSEIVASTMCSTKTHSLDKLKEEDSWSLFKENALPNRDAHFPNVDFEGTGREITKNCKRLPLALKTIGKLLKTKSSIKEWKDILGSEIWEVDKDIIPPALRLSYHHLPSLLKRCFAYCSIFPKDYKFSKEHLIELWMAENFFSAQQRKDLKVVGDQVFHDLLSRSFFQQSSGDKTCYIMHDLIHDLAKNASGDFCFRLQETKAQNTSKFTRHFSYIQESFGDSARKFDVICNAERLRTFMHDLPSDPLLFLSNSMIRDLLLKFRCLHVLNLSGYSNIIKLPKSIGKLKHLRYLNLSKTGIKRLPDSICSLYNLQTLKLGFCQDLEELPNNLHKLINLRHLDFCETKVKNMPKRMGELRNLQVFSSFVVGDCEETDIRQLGDLDLGGALSILDLQNVTDSKDCLAANLKNKRHLEELAFGWSMKNEESHKESDVLENLQPPRNLKKLSISNFESPNFPSWLTDNTLSFIVSLELMDCKYCSSLPSLGLLSTLKSLSIVGLDSVVAVGPEFCGNNSCTTPFVSLEILRFEEMKGREEWNCEDVHGSFPCLQEFYLKGCPKLRELHIPAQLPSLTLLIISNCKQLVAALLRAPSVHELMLLNCGKVQLECLPSTLKDLRIGEPFTKCFSAEMFENMVAHTCLENLVIADCSSLGFPLPHGHNFLQRISICNCDSLRTFPLDLFPRLKKLELEQCGKLETLSVGEGQDHRLTSLLSLELIDCHKFESFPKGGISAPKLGYFHVEGLQSLKSLPKRMHILFPALRILHILDCPRVESFSEGGLPRNVKVLFIKGSQKLVVSRREWGLHNRTCLQSLRIQDEEAECLPEPDLLPPTLTELIIEECFNVKTLDYNGLRHLSALRDLHLLVCPKLKCYPKEGLPTSIHTLFVFICPKLKKRCQKKKGREWSKIAHIPLITFDDDVLT